MWGEFERAGVELSAAHYGTLLTVLADNGHGHLSPKVNSVRSFVLNLDTKLLFDVNLRCNILFQEILSEMTTKGIEPNAVFDAAMVVAHCSLGDIEKAMTVLEEMRADGVPANRHVFHALIREEVWSDRGIFESVKSGIPQSLQKHTNYICVYLWYDLTG